MITADDIARVLALDEQWTDRRKLHGYSYPDDAIYMAASTNPDTGYAAMARRVRELEQELMLLRRTFGHYHVEWDGNGDRCKQCGYDLCNLIHWGSKS